MKVRVDPELCMGHTMCQARAAEVFTLSEDGFNEMGEFDVPDGLAAAVRRGAVACPERAITILDGQGGT
ncbi:ferredoxin [Streptomyces sp. NPDC127117]|uniref:ferredoxin n=1 Tax=Streptomyces sp. NPDC127117 TaxID=3345368 RepID=UPI00362AB271